MKLSTVTALSLLSAFFGDGVCFPGNQETDTNTHRNTVESEGPQGLWAQSAEDPTKAELQELERLIKVELSKQEDLTIVTKDDPHDMLGLSIVAEKVGKRPGSEIRRTSPTSKPFH